jgi:hypothetical protein
MRSAAAAKAGPTYCDADDDDENDEDDDEMDGGC